MEVLDYARSFVTFVTPGNQARLQLEGRCVLSGPAQEPEEYLMFASCKAEDTYGTLGGLLVEPGYDFSGIFSATRYRLHRVHPTTAAEALDAGEIAGRFAAMRPYHLCAASARSLNDIPTIIEATLANQVIIARNEITSPATGVMQVLEYPVKTMNVNPNTVAFQVDTGPLPLYDFACQDAEIMARFRWAYCAFNDFTGAEFLCQAPLPMVHEGQEVCRSTMYSQRVVHATARNSLFALEE